MASNTKIAAVVGLLCESYNRKPTSATFKAYELVLSDVTDDQLDAGANRAMRSSGSFMPTPGQLRELSVTGGSWEARAELAFHELDRAVTRYGADYSVSFEDGLINAAVRLLGGWQYVCSKSDADFEVWLRKAFMRTYVDLCQSSQIQPKLLRPLVGNYERQNRNIKDLPSLANLYNGQIVTVQSSQPVLVAATERPRLGSIRELVERKGLPAPTEETAR